MQQAIDYEVQWQIDTIENGGKIHQATILFNPDTGETRAMRSKEDAHDYRYFPDPDLLPLEISSEWVEEMRELLPELPDVMCTRFQQHWGLSAYDAHALTSDRNIAEYFIRTAKFSCKDGETFPIQTHWNSVDIVSFTDSDFKLCANWVINEVSARMNQDNLPSWCFGVSAETLGRILQRVREGVINAKTAKDILMEFWDVARESGFKQLGGSRALVDQLIEERGLKQVSDSGAIEALVDEIIAGNADKVAEYRSGKDKLFGFFVGLAMKASKGKANPAQLNDILKKKLEG
jgi:aspartyl-tRNA(Asn)/glutamyl-tRNA(Gln) amidotransferase subunit B